MPLRCRTQTVTGLSLVFCLTIAVSSQSAFAENKATSTKASASKASIQSARVGSLQKMGALKIETIKGKKISLKQVARNAFEKQNQLVSALNKKGVQQQALLKKPVVKQEVADLGDTFKLTQSTTFTVVDSAKLQSIAPGFSFKAKKKKSVNKLSSKERKMLANIMATAKTLDARDPIRIAAEKGEQSLLDALRDGVGTMTISENVTVPKQAIMIKGGFLQMPTIEDGVMNFKKVVPVKAPFSAKAVKKALQQEAVIQNSQQPSAQAQLVGNNEIARVTISNGPKKEVGGVHEFKLELVNGETYGTSWIWEEKWDIPSGFFRFTAGCAIAVGLRVPVVVEGKVTPISSNVVDSRDINTRVTTELAVDTLDADADYYARAGLSPQYIHDGKEFVFNISVGHGYKLYFGGVDVLYKKYETFDLVDFSQDTKPPFGDYNAQAGIDIEIPPTLTKTGFKLGIFNGSLTFGVHVNGRGKFALERRDIENGKYSAARKMGFENSSPVTYKKTVARLPNSGRTRFGVSLDHYNYHLHNVYITPQLKFVFKIKHSFVDITRESPWIRFYDLGLQMPDFALETHSGTRSQYTWEGGLKQFSKITPSKDKDKGSSKTSASKPTPKATPVRRRAR